MYTEKEGMYLHMYTGKEEVYYTCIQSCKVLLANYLTYVTNYLTYVTVLTKVG